MPKICVMFFVGESNGKYRMSVQPFVGASRLLLEEKLSPQVTDEVCGLCQNTRSLSADTYCGNTSSVSPLDCHLPFKGKALVRCKTGCPLAYVEADALGGPCIVLR